MPRNSPKARPPAKAAHDRRMIAKLKLQGFTQDAIAAQLSLSQATVSRELEKLNKLWLEETRISVTTWRSRELKKLELIEKEAWGAWEISKSAKAQPAKVPTPAGAMDDTIAKLNQLLEAEQQPGDASHLATVLKCLDRRAKMLGLDVTLEQQAEAKAQSQMDKEWSAAFNVLMSSPALPDHVKILLLDEMAAQGRLLQQAAIAANQGDE